MIGIQSIAYHIPEGRVSNYDRMEKFSITEEFINKKIGVKAISVKDPKDQASDLCVKAFKNLRKEVDIDPKSIDALIVVTQNPDFNIPHTSAIVHGKLGLPTSCACLDISLGCSGYVYALSAMQAFMKENEMKKGLLFTSDPYSKIIDPDDKNTSLLFGDAASVTVLGEDPLYESGKFTFGTIGKDYKELICEDKFLFMNGRAVFNFVAKQIPQDIERLLEINRHSINDIDKIVFHQGSRHMIECLKKRMSLPCDKVVFDVYDYGNTVSSSIPILLADVIKDPSNQNVIISGFGVGLSWSSTILKRR